MIYRFADYSFDTDRGLEGSAGRISLRRTDLALLRVLLEADGRTVTKNQIIATAWQGRAVTDDSISQAVMRLRRALPCGRGDQIVQRVHGTGLRLGVAAHSGDGGRARQQPQVPSATTAARAHLSSARELSGRRNPTDSAAAVQAARRAITLDPDNAELWAGLAEILAYRLALELESPAETGIVTVAAAQEALDRDPDSAPALAVRGWVRCVVQGDLQRGLEDLERSIAIEDSYWLARLQYSWALLTVRRTAEATAEMRVVDSLNPWGVWNAGMLGLFLMFDGRLDEALVEARHAIRQFPHLDTANLRHSVVASANKIHDEAIASARRAAEQSPDLPLMQSGLASALARGGRREEAFAVLRRMEESTLPLPGALLASAWLALGARERAIEMLRLARRVQSPYLQYAFVDPRLQELRSDPDFQCLQHTG